MRLHSQLFAALLVAISNAAISAQQSQRPNLITIVSDDQGCWAMGAYGNTEIQTPHADSLAAEGALFSQAFVASPVCSPSRATYLTGLYPTELGITDWISPSEAQSGVGLAAQTWPMELQKAGYRTALIGKWHLGDRPQFHPTQLGFDEFYGFLGGGNRPMNPQLEINGIKQKLTGSLPDLLTDAAIKFVSENSHRLFALSLHFRAPHLPYGPVPEADTQPFRNLDPTIPDFPGLDRPQIKKRTLDYYASIHSIDRNVGRLLQVLRELELHENTLVVYTSDHGYNEGRHGINTKGNGHWVVGGRTGPKRPNMWDTSLKVPLVIRWPSRIPAGTVIDYPVSNLDMYRFVLGALSVPLPDNCKARGMDYSPLLTNSASLEKRPALFGQYDLRNNGLAYLRMVRTSRYKLVWHFHTRFMHELYDLKEDPGEKKNLLRGITDWEKTPAVAQQLKNEMVRWMIAIEDPLIKDSY